MVVSVHSLLYLASAVMPPKFSFFDCKPTSYFKTFSNPRLNSLVVDVSEHFSQDVVDVDERPFPDLTHLPSKLEYVIVMGAVVENRNKRRQK